RNDVCLCPHRCRQLTLARRDVTFAEFAARITVVDGIIARIRVLVDSRREPEGVLRHKAPQLRVIVARPQVIEARLAVELSRGEAEGVRHRIRRRPVIAPERLVLVLIDENPGAIHQPHYVACDVLRVVEDGVGRAPAPQAWGHGRSGSRPWRSCRTLGSIGRYWSAEHCTRARGWNPRCRHRKKW